MPGKERFNPEQEPHEDSLERFGAFCVWRTSDQELALETVWRIINDSPFIAFLWDAKDDWAVKYVTENVEALTGYSVREFMKGDVSYADIIHPDDLPRVRSEVEKWSSDPSAAAFSHAPYRIQVRGGPIKWVADQTRIQRNTSGEITHYQGIVHDITQALQTEAALKESEQKLREERELLKRILDATSEGVIYIDRGYRVVRANEVAADMCGLSRDVVEGKNCYEVFHNERCHTDACFLRRMGDGAAMAEGEVSLSCVLGTQKEIPAAIMGRAVKDSAGGFAGVVESMRDLTEWKKNENRTRRALELRALAEGYAQMSALLLHRVGNLLTPMQVEIEWMQTRGAEQALDYLEKGHNELMEHLSALDRCLGYDERGKKVFSFMQKAILALKKGEQKLSHELKELAAVVSRMSEILTLQEQYTVIGHEEKESLDVNDRIENSLRMQASMMEAKGIQVKKKLAQGLKPVVMERRRMQFLIDSLIRNGWDTTARERGAECHDRWIGLTTYERNGSVCLEVQYRGCGNDWAETQALLEQGRISAGSSDIALYFCKQLIEAGNGALSVEHTGRGQEITVKILFGDNA